MYSTIESYNVPVQRSAAGAVAGAAIGALVGAVVLATVVNVDRAVHSYSATAVRPVVQTAIVSLPSQTAQTTSYAAPLAAQATDAQDVNEVSMQVPQGLSVYGWVAFAAIAGAINGLFLWNSRKVSMASTTGRREALMAGVTAASMAAAPAFAAYGEGANVFGKPKDVEQFFTVSGAGWSAIIPGKYNASKEREFEGIVGRWEDNFDAVNNSLVIVRPIGKNSVQELGGLDQVRDAVVSPLLGQQAFTGASISEGGFAPGRYSSAAVLDQKEETKNGKTYYYYELLSRTADGNEGGRHQLFSVTVSNGNLYVFKTQAGDKRWFKGLERPLRASLNSFTVA